MKNTVVFLSVLLSCVEATTRAPPKLNFSLSAMKTPQLIGVVAGLLVFVITILAVIILLIKSGTYGRYLEEVQSGKPIQLPTKANLAPTVAGPELYDYLLDATRDLPAVPKVPDLVGKRVILKPVVKSMYEELFSMSNGSAQFHESKYDPERLWCWLHRCYGISTKDAPAPRPFESLEDFTKCLESQQGLHLAMHEPSYGKVIGMLSLVDNDVRNLSIGIDNIWLTPAFQNSKIAHESMFLIVQWLINQGYRRISVAVDARHVVGRKFIERCGFLLEATLRKHLIVNNRNRDSTLYVIFNSDWEHVSINLKKYLGLPLQPEKHKIAEIDEPAKAGVGSAARILVLEEDDSTKEDTNGNEYEVVDEVGEVDAETKKQQ